MGNVYVGDAGNNLIRMITPSAVVTTLAGNGVAGFVNNTMASFNLPTGVAVDGGGNVYVADQSNFVIRTITSSGLVSTLAGSGIQGSANGTGTAASFYEPSGVAVDAVGNVYVADFANNLIRKISQMGVPSLGFVTTLAGSGTRGSANGTGTAASFSAPSGVAVDNAGNVYVADLGNSLIREISPSGVVTTLAGSGTRGSTNGTGTAASFEDPQGVAVDAAGNVYVADAGANLIRKISPSGVVTTLAGSGTPGSANLATATASTFNEPYGVAVDAAGNVYVADYGNNMIREISLSGLVTTLAGSGARGSTNGSGPVASFNGPMGVAVDKGGNVYVADALNNLIRIFRP